jgi:hypothetical protein
VKVLVESIQHVSYKTTVQRYKYLLWGFWYNMRSSWWWWCW